MAAMLFALIANRVDERFFAAEGERSNEVLRRGIVPLTRVIDAWWDIPRPDVGESAEEVTP